MSREPSSEEWGKALLLRLPPGRHGLPREFVSANQRARITAATIALAAKHGFEALSVGAIVAAAGLSRRSFYTYHRDKRAALLAAYDEVEAFLAAEAGAAAAAEQGWRAKLAAALAPLLEAFAANPDLATFLVAVPQRAGAGLLDRYREMIAGLAAAAISADPGLREVPLLEARLAGLAAIALDGARRRREPGVLAAEICAVAAAWAGSRA